MSWDEKGGWGQGSPERGWPVPGESFRTQYHVTIIGDYLVQGGGAIHSPNRTDWDTGDGFWIGVDGDGVAKFGLGDSTGVQITWDGTTLTVEGDGSGLTSIDGGNIQTGTVTADALNVSTLSAISADMGSLTAGQIVIGTTNKLWLNDSDDGALAIGGSVKASAPFRVTAAGALTATNATITGAITASSGSVTGTLSMGASGIIVAGTGTLDDDLTGIAFNNEIIVAQVSGVSQWVLSESGMVIRIDAGVATNDLLFYNNAEAADAARLQVQYDGGTNDHQLDLLCYGYDFSTTTTVRIAAVNAGSALADLFLTDATIYTTTADVGIGVSSLSATLHVKQGSSSGAQPVLLLEQADVSEEFARFVGTAAAATLTQSIVAEADVSTATRQGFLRVYVQDDGNQITDQAYYIPIYTLA